MRPFVVLDKLNPAERLAFVLHDMFGVPFAEIAPIVDRTPEAARQLASRARRKVRGAPEPDADVAAQAHVVAFLAAAHEGDFEALLRVLDPKIVLQIDTGALVAVKEVRGAEAVAQEARGFTARLDVPAGARQRRRRVRRAARRGAVLGRRIHRAEREDRRDGPPRRPRAHPPPRPEHRHLITPPRAVRPQDGRGVGRVHFSAGHPRHRGPV